MPIYKVKVNMSISKVFNIEAKDNETAGEKAEAEFYDEIPAEAVFEGAEIEESELSGDQYTALQEDQDEEHRYNKKFG